MGRPSAADHTRILIRPSIHRSELLQVDMRDGNPGAACYSSRRLTPAIILSILYTRGRDWWPGWQSRSFVCSKAGIMHRSTDTYRCRITPTSYIHIFRCTILLSLYELEMSYFPHFLSNSRGSYLHPRHHWSHYHR